MRKKNVRRRKIAVRKSKSDTSRSSSPRKPPSESILKDIDAISKAIRSVKKVVNLAGRRSILASLYGEKRYAENLLRKNYPRLAKSRGIASRQKETIGKSKAAETFERTTKGEKIARGWRFAKAIKENYGNDPLIAKMSKADIRREYRKFRQGKKTKVSDIVWYNPSP